MTFKLVLKDESGQTHLANISWLKNQLKLNHVPLSPYFVERIVNIELCLIEILKPQITKDLLVFLEANEGINTRKLNDWIYGQTTYRQKALMDVRDNLLSSGQIEAISQGKGQARKWFKVKD